jgi:hypothetical protein
LFFEEEEEEEEETRMEIGEEDESVSRRES